MLQGVFGLLTGWVLLTPAVLVAYLQLGGGYHSVMAPVLGMAASLPLLLFLTLAGFVLIGLSGRRLGQPRDLDPPR